MRHRQRDLWRDRDPAVATSRWCTQYCARQRRHDHRSSEAPHLSNGVAITQSLHGHFQQLASDIYERRLSLTSLCSMRRSTRSPATSPPMACTPGAPSRRRRSPHTARRQAKAVAGWRSQESPHAARTAREPCAGDRPRPVSALWAPHHPPIRIKAPYRLALRRDLFP